MDNTFLALVIAILAATPGVLALVIGQKKIKAETERLLAEAGSAEGVAADKITSAALQLVTPLKDRIKEQDAELVLKNSLLLQKQTENDNLVNQLIKLREIKLETDSGVERLLYQFKALQVEPVWRPKSNGDVT